VGFSGIVCLVRVVMDTTSLIQLSQTRKAKFRSKAYQSVNGATYSHVNQINIESIFICTSSPAWPFMEQNLARTSPADFIRGKSCRMCFPS